MRQVRVVSRIAWPAVVVALALAQTPVRAGGTEYATAILSIPIELTTAIELPATARESLVAEAAAIWRKGGVRLQWRSPSGLPAAPDAALRVLVMMRAASRATGEHRSWPVAELVADQVGDGIAIASIHGAQRVIESAGYVTDTSALSDHRLGIVLGRAIAHEIGHYLLRTSSHARSGLMRTGVGARDFADLRDGGFYLDTNATRWVRQHSVLGMTPRSQLARFSY